MNQLFSFLDVIPEGVIALTAYGIGAIIALWCWWRLMRRLPTTLGAISWLVVFAILVTPTVSEGPNASVAPAIFGLLFGVLTKDSPLIWSNLSLILFVVGLGLVIGYCWSKYSTNKNMRSI
ncbi:putative membrane protein [Acinetobacter lactucae]|nr:putative membrane protein [Acinetobacter lactucae]